MHSDLFSCCICSLDYDRAHHLPKILPACGHTICQACLQSILQRQTQATCPLDRAPFSNEHRSVDLFPTNLALLQIIEERLKAENKVCKAHKEARDYVCLTDRRMVCRSCVEGKHRSHKVLHVQDVKSKAILKKRQMQIMVDDFDLWKETLDDQVNSAKKTMLRSSQGMLKRCSQSPYGRKEVNTEADLWFALKKLELEEKLEGDIRLREEVVRKISILGREAINGEFLEALEEEMPSFEFQDEDSSLSLFIDELRSQFDSNQRQCTSLVTPVKQVQFIKMPQLELLEDNLTPITSDSAQEVKVERWREIFKVESLDGWLFISSKDDIPSSGYGSHFLTSEKLNAVTKVSLDLAKDTISKDMLQAMQDLWEDLKEVTHLKVNFLNKDLTDSELSMLLCHAFWATEELESFVIDLEECSVSDESMITLMKDVLPKMTGLNSIELHLGETKITDASIQAFSRSALPILENLEHFNLDLYGTSITDLAISQLLFGMKDVASNLKSFALSLSKTKITELSIHLLAESVLPLMNDLESCELYLCDVGVTDSGAGQLLLGLKQGAWNLKNLLINLGSTKITDKTIEIFSQEMLPVMEDIEHVELFFYNTLVSDVSIQQMINKVDNLVDGTKDMESESSQVIKKRLGVKVNEALVSKSLKFDRLCC